MHDAATAAGKLIFAAKAKPKIVPPAKKPQAHHKSPTQVTTAGLTGTVPTRQKGRLVPVGNSDQLPECPDSFLVGSKPNGLEPAWSPTEVAIIQDITNDKERYRVTGSKDADFILGKYDKENLAPEEYEPEGQRGKSPTPCSACRHAR